MAAAARFFLLLTVLATASVQQATAATLTLMNSCDYMVWPGIQAGTAELSTTGFLLQEGQSVTLDVPAVWSGRIWGRTGCNFDESGQGKCATGDCEGTLRCNVNGVPPATLAEFSLGNTAVMQDFYDVSVVDGFNLPLMVSAKGGQGACAATGCLEDLNRKCPKELQVAGNVACKSACMAFNTPQYCCNGPDPCKASNYSQLFKNACPRSYTYATDDANATFTCSGADYVITFCQAITGQKRSSTPANTNARISSSNNNNADDDPSSSNVAWDVNTTAAPSLSACACVSASSSSAVAFFFGTLLLLLLWCR